MSMEGAFLKIILTLYHMHFQHFETNFVFYNKDGDTSFQYCEVCFSPLTNGNYLVRVWEGDLGAKGFMLYEREFRGIPTHGAAARFAEMTLLNKQPVKKR